MPKKSAKNNDLLREVKDKTTPQVYALILNLVNEDREDMAELVVKIDYLFDYTNTCIRDKDFNEAKECLQKAKVRMDKLRDEKIQIEHLEYLYEGIINRMRK
jgi:hypothetical protein